MEAQLGGGEVRRLHIVYFLSRKGHIEHPHLIRVHHPSRNGVRLRDVKRWLGELRGKDISESFSWSYKRRYKTGYVWQDLLDDDLITPISDNEYVIKGSEISSTLKVGKQKEQQDQKTTSKEENQSHSSETAYHVSTKSSSEIEEESPTFGSETSTLTDDSARNDMAGKVSGTTKHENPISDDIIKRSSTFYSTLFSKKKSKKVSTDDEKITADEAAAASASAESCKLTSSELPQRTKSKNHSNGASKIIKTLITCGDVDTNDSVKAIDKQDKASLKMCSTDHGSVRSGAISKRDSFGGSHRIFGNPNWTKPQLSSRKSFDGVKDSSKEHRVACAAYKPVNGPNCSQCGKPFKPEKLHGHMKSCKGMKAAMSKCAADSKASKGSMEFGQQGTVSGHLLTH